MAHRGNFKPADPPRRRGRRKRIPEPWKGTKVYGVGHPLTERVLRLEDTVSGLESLVLDIGEAAAEIVSAADEPDDKIQ